MDEGWLHNRGDTPLRSRPRRLMRTRHPFLSAALRALSAAESIRLPGRKIGTRQRYARPGRRRSRGCSPISWQAGSERSSGTARRRGPGLVGFRASRGGIGGEFSPGNGCVLRLPTEQDCGMTRGMVTYAPGARFPPSAVAQPLRERAPVALDHSPRLKPEDSWADHRSFRQAWRTLVGHIGGLRIATASGVDFRRPYGMQSV